MKDTLHSLIQLRSAELIAEAEDFRRVRRTRPRARRGRHRLALTLRRLADRLEPMPEPDAEPRYG